MSVLVAAAGAAAVLVGRASTPARPGPAPTAGASPWSILAAPDPGGQSVLHSIACGSPSACIAVGSFSVDGNALVRHGLVESWNGSSWALLPSPNPGTDTELQSVACRSPASCVAVGSFGAAGSPDAQHALAESWDGSAWSAVQVPSPGSRSALQAVVCPSPTSCTAVGSFTAADSSLPQALVAAWDGATWSALPAPPPPGSADDWLTSVACGSARSCVAVGSYSTTGDGDGPDAHTLVESWDGGSWSFVPSPSPGTGYESLLSSVACPSPSTCIAVGSYSPRGDPYNAADQQSLVEAGTGGAWSLVPTPSTPGRVLQSISCPSPAACVAVGSPAAAAVSQSVPSLVESWAGAAWSVVPVPAASGTLESVACPAPGSCLAAGERDTAAHPAGQVLVERRRGP